MFVCLLVALFSPSFSQVGVDSVLPTQRNPNLDLGFNLGINFPTLDAQSGLPLYATQSNGLGVRMGILANYRVSKLFSLSPKAELSFDKLHVDILNADGSEERYDVMQSHLNFAAHVLLKKKSDKLNPYMFFGPSYRLPIALSEDPQPQYGSNSTFAFDVGVGLENTGQHFNFSPELRYSHGLQNVNQHPMLPNMSMHNISLILNFVG